MLGDIDPEEFFRIVSKVRAEGLSALTEEEAATYDAGHEALRPYVEMAASQMEHPSFALWDWTGDAVQERYADLTPDQLAELWAKGLELEDSE